MKVLVVDDEPAIRLLVAEALQDSGFEVVEAASGNEAIVLLGAPDFIQLLLTDLNLGGLVDGIDVALSARRRRHDLPILFMSGRPDLVRSSTRTPKPYMLLSKPFGLAEMVGAVRALAGSATCE